MPPGAQPLAAAAAHLPTGAGAPAAPAPWCMCMCVGSKWSLGFDQCYNECVREGDMYVHFSALMRYVSKAVELGKY